MSDKHKYLVIIDQYDPGDYTIEDDVEDYDGPECNIDDEDGVYHIEAETPEEALETARFLDQLGNPSYGRGVLDEEY